MRAFRFLKLSIMVLGVLGATLMMATPAHAQSAIAGVVRDTSGAVMPGVTVDASSPALIEKVRSVATDDQGQYRVIDLRPGTYSVTFSLPGFSTVKRDGIELEADFTATVNAEMKVGELNETITVSGQAPVVDVQSTQRREVLSRELLQTLPAVRTFSTNTIPAVRMNDDVGGSGAMQHRSMTVYGSTDGTELQVDGMGVRIINNQAGNYQNYGSFEEVVYQVGGGSAEATIGAVTVNMIPRTGGNTFTGEAVGIVSNRRTQGSNYTPDLAARGLRVPEALWRLWDVNISVGGPIKQDRLWFFYSHRNWATNNYVADQYDPVTGKQGVYDNQLYAHTTRLTGQINSKNKVTVLYDWLSKNQGHVGIEAGNVEPKAARLSRTPVPVIIQGKWTSTVSNKLLLEAGYSENYFTRQQLYEPEVARPSVANPYGDIAKRDLATGRIWNAAPGGENHWWVPGYKYVASVSYVTGSHSYKVGTQWTLGHVTTNIYAESFNGGLIQLYRNGVPDSVDVTNAPVLPVTNLDRDRAFYVQDSWTIRRLTLNPGLRLQQLKNSIPEQHAPAGRFVPARDFAAIPDLIDYTTIAPRVGAAYDLFGDGRTAIKGSIGKYNVAEGAAQALMYNPMVFGTDTRTWTDRNGNDIAEDSEIGPPRSRTFGVRRNRNPDPNLDWPYSWLTNIGIQHELRQGLGVSATYNRRDYRKLYYTDNLATTSADYTLVTIPNPRGSGTLPVYNLAPNKFGIINELDTNSDNNRNIFDGVDLTASWRIPNGGTLMVGTSTGRLRTILCDVEDPNEWGRFCDQTQFDVPFRTTFKVVASTALPYDIRVSGVFQSNPGLEIVNTYSVGRAIVPNLTQASVLIKRVNEPGSLYYERNNQLDIAIGREFRVNRTRLTPKIELYNLLNVNPVLTQVLNVGPSLGRPLTVLPARVARFNILMTF